MIREEHHQRVLVVAGFLERVEYPAHGVVNVAHLAHICRASLADVVVGGFGGLAVHLPVREPPGLVRSAALAIALRKLDLAAIEHREVRLGAGERGVGVLPVHPREERLPRLLLAR